MTCFIISLIDEKPVRLFTVCAAQVAAERLPEIFTKSFSQPQPLLTELLAELKHFKNPAKRNFRQPLRMLRGAIYEYKRRIYVA